ncbi:hypothetical protein M8J76_000584 [Diaphorina citri]|nr:hypothetical protein M8J76_000584 [Diaphorina citri]
MNNTDVNTDIVQMDIVLIGDAPVVIPPLADGSGTMESSTPKISANIDIKCKKCKDFFGTPQQLFFCSVCYQNHLKQQKQRSEHAR